MADLKERPDVETIMRFRSKMGELWANAHNEFRDNDAYYQRKFKVWNDNYQGRPVFHDSTATHIVNHAVDTLMSFSPKIHREPMGDTEQHKQDATNLENALKAIMDDSAKRETAPTWKLMAHYLILHGYSVLEGPILVGLHDRPDEPVQSDFDTEEEYEGARAIYRANRRTFNPVRIRVPHPSTVLINPNEKIPTMAIKASKMTAQDLHEQSITKKRKQRRKYSEIFDMGNYDPWDEVETWDYWTPYWHVKLLASSSANYGSPSSRAATPIWMERNTMSYVPYVHAFSGFGIDIMETGGDPANLAQGILTPNKETIRKRTQELSAFHQILLRFAFAPMGTSRDPMTLAQAIANEGILEGDPQDFWVMNTPDVPNWALQLRGQTDNTLEMGTYSSALAGVRQAGVTTVGQQAILNTAGMRTFSAPAMQREHMASIIGSRVLQLVDSVSELSGGIGANGKTMTKSLISSVYDVDVRFPHADPVMEMQSRQQALTEFQAGLIDPMTFYEIAGYENGTEIKKRLIEEIVRNLPSIREQMETLAAQELGLVDEANQTQVTEEIGMRQEAMAPQVPGVNGAGGGGMGGGGDLNRALTPDTFRPDRIDLGR